MLGDLITPGSLKDMYNRDSNSEELHDTLREDFHQVLAYTSFSTVQQKKNVIVYPYNEFKHYKTTAYSSINDCVNDTFIIGVPISKTAIDDIINSLENLL